MPQWLSFLCALPFFTCATTATAPAATKHHAALTTVAAPTHIFANVAPPKNATDTRHAVFHATDYMSSQSDALVTSTASVGKFYRLWTNRCNPASAVLGGDPYDGCIGSTMSAGSGNVVDAPLNPVTGVTYRTADNALLFSSHRLADQCTLAQAAYVLGMAPADVTVSYGAGLTMVFDPGSYVPPAMASNICIMPLAGNSAPDGIALDYEPQDGRTTAMATAFLTQFANLVHVYMGKRAILDTNPLDGSGVGFSGIDKSNAGSINKLFDFMSIHIVGKSPVSTEFSNQSAIIGTPDYSRIMLTMDLAGPLRVADFKTARDIMTSKGIPAAKFKTNGAVESPMCPDDMASKTTCLATGTCRPNC